MIKEVKIEITSLCYRNCIHCSSEATLYKPRFLDKELVKKVIDEAKELGATSITFTGGEPTLYKGLDELINYAKEKGLTTTLYSMALRTKSNLKLYEKLINVGLDEIIYSTANELSRYEVVEEDYELFFKKLLTYNVKLGFHHVVTNNTINSINKVIDLKAILSHPNFNKMSFLRYVPHGRGDTSLVLTSSELKMFKELLLELYKKYPDKIRIGSPHNVLNISHSECTAGSKTLVIGSDGSVYPCDALKYNNYLGTSGNIKEDSLLEIYTSPYFNKIREYFNHYGDSCMDCNNFEICKGGCIAQKILYAINYPGIKTFRWYEVNAKRTMNSFTKDELRNNAKTGIAGEMGELIDCIKKLLTHSCSPDKIELIKKIMIDEIGDLIWYIAAPLTSYYDFSLEDIASELFNASSNNILRIDDNIMEYSAKNKDPLCPYLKNSYLYTLTKLDKAIKISSLYELSKEWEELDDLAYLIRKSEDKDEIITYSGQLLLALTKLCNLFLNITIEEVISLNVDRLQDRYPSGFDSIVANNRIEVEKKYISDKYLKQLKYKI
ncbi:MAG: radical SAM protein [Bacilli bacterium]